MIVERPALGVWPLTLPTFDGFGVWKSVSFTKPVLLMLIRATVAINMLPLAVAVARMEEPPDVAENVKLFASTTLLTKNICCVARFIADGGTLTLLLPKETFFPTVNPCFRNLI